MSRGGESEADKRHYWHWRHCSHRCGSMWHFVSSVKARDFICQSVSDSSLIQAVIISAFPGTRGESPSTTTSMIQARIQRAAIKMARVGLTDFAVIAFDSNRHCLASQVLTSIYQVSRL